MVGLTLDRIECSYGSHRILGGVSIAGLPVGGITALVGPNAAGKTTLLKCIAGILKHDGAVRLDDRELGRMKRDDMTRHISYLPQEIPVHAVLTAFEAVLLAKQQSFAWRVADDDLALVEGILHALDIDDLAMRYLNELSGGQRQLVSIAQALVRECSVMLLDEPTSNLDLQRQLEVLRLVASHAAAARSTAVVTMHDLNLASRYADHIVVLRHGEVYAAGAPKDVITADMLRDVYGVRAHVAIHDDGVPQVHAVESMRGLVLS